MKTGSTRRHVSDCELHFGGHLKSKRCEKMEILMKLYWETDDGLTLKTEKQKNY